MVPRLFSWRLHLQTLKKCSPAPCAAQAAPRAGARQPPAELQAALGLPKTANAPSHPPSPAFHPRLPHASLPHSHPHLARSAAIKGKRPIRSQSRIFFFFIIFFSSRRNLPAKSSGLVRTRRKEINRFLAAFNPSAGFKQRRPGRPGRSPGASRP